MTIKTTAMVFVSVAGKIGVVELDLPDEPVVTVAVVVMYLMLVVDAFVTCAVVVVLMVVDVVADVLFTAFA